MRRAVRAAEFCGAAAAALVVIWLVETKTPLAHATHDTRAITAAAIVVIAMVIDMLRHRNRSRKD